MIRNIPTKYTQRLFLREIKAQGFDKCIDFLYLPSMRFTRRCDPEPVYDSWDERFLASEIERVGAFLDGLRINLIDLRRWEPAPETEEMRKDCRRLAHIDAINMETRMERKAEDNDLEEIRFRLNLDAARRAASYFGARKPDLAVLFNGGVMEYGALFDVARRENRRASSLFTAVWLSLSVYAFVCVDYNTIHKPNTSAALPDKHTFIDVPLEEGPLLPFNSGACRSRSRAPRPLSRPFSA